MKQADVKVIEVAFREWIGAESTEEELEFVANSELVVASEGIPNPLFRRQSGGVVLTFRVVK